MAGVLARQWWNLERFGLTPTKLLSRLQSSSMPRIVCNSIPKSGTHLLERTLCLHPHLYRRLTKTVRDHQVNSQKPIERWLADLKPGEMYFCHLLYREHVAEAIAAADVRCLFMVRDLRDVLVSDAIYVPTNKHHRYHRMYLQQPDLRSRLRLSLLGDPEHDFPSFGTRMRRFSGWLDSCAQVIRFEDLIGESGGGDRGRQFRTLDTIFRFLGMPVDRRQIEALCRRVFSDVSPTFRQGRIGKGIEHFDDELQQLFECQVGDLMREWGYDSAGNVAGPVVQSPSSESEAPYAPS